MESWAALLLALLGGAGVTTRVAADPILHEYVELGDGRGPVEPLVTGDHPSTSGATAPVSPTDGPTLRNDADPVAPSGTSLRMDADTSRPARVDYEDPFTPTIVPFKRGSAYDGVNAEGDLVVVDRRVVALASEPPPGAIDEHFRASLSVDLEANEPAAIPSVAPGARLVIAHAQPPADVWIGVDSAENWFVRSKRSGLLQLTLQLTADRRVFGSEFRDASWTELARELPAVPENVKSSALEVARTLGVGSTARPKRAVASLVEHFRRFSPSERKPASRGLALYRDLALTGRGICRHRAYAFMVTALGLGIPTRYVTNEAHAWVEVYDGEIWHRIDLGGAAERLSMRETGRPRHVEPRDPFPWQNPSESGHALAQRRNEPAAAAATSEPAGAPQPYDSAPGSDGQPAPSGGAPAPEDAPPAPGAPPTDSPVPEEVPSRAPDPPQEETSSANVRLQTNAKSAERGKTLYVAGQVREQGRACAGSSVDVRLATEAGPVALGTLVTDASGDFSGRLVIPWDAPLGEHRLEATALGPCTRR